MAGISPGPDDKGSGAAELTDSEYKGFIRFAFDALKEAEEKREKEERTAELAESLQALQTTGED